MRRKRGFPLLLIVLSSVMIVHLGNAAPSSDNPKKENQLVIRLKDFLSKSGHLNLIEQNFITDLQNGRSYRSRPSNHKIGMPTFQDRYGLSRNNPLDNGKFQQFTRKRRYGVANVLGPSNYERYPNIFGHGWQKWNKNYLTYYISNPLWGSLDRSKFVGELKRAFDAWSEVTNLNFGMAFDYVDADIKIAFGRRRHGECAKYGFDFDGPITGYGHYVTGTELAHAYPPQSVLKGILHFDGDESWTTDKGSCRSCQDFYPVALHEIGHILGLNHIANEQSIMHYSDKDSNTHLTIDDIRGIQSLYGRRSGFTPPPIDDTTNKPPIRRECNFCRKNEQCFWTMDGTPFCKCNAGFKFSGDQTLGCVEAHSEGKHHEDNITEKVHAPVKRPRRRQDI